ncbi:hypothetical protein FZEAL_10472, partial [Fusarium zealandicum]
MESSTHNGPARRSGLPPEIWQQIIDYSIETLRVPEAFRLRLVSRQISGIAMQAIYESDLLFNFSHSRRRACGHEFWTRYLEARVLDRVRTKKPTYDHLLIRRLAEITMEWRANERAAGGRMAQNADSDLDFDKLVYQV